MKFLAIKDQFDIESGEDDNRYFARLNNIFLQRYGKPFEYRAVAKYLEDKPKWLAYTKTVSNEEKGPKRPAGKKLTLKQQAEKRKEEEEKEALETMVNDVAAGVSDALRSGDREQSQCGEACDHFYSTVSGVLSQIAVHLEDSTLDDESRAVVQQERSKIRILELKAKRRRLEAQETAGDSPTELVVTAETNDGGSDDVLTQYSF